jgi:hypothetical protein
MKVNTVKWIQSTYNDVGPYEILYETPEKRFKTEEQLKLYQKTDSAWAIMPLVGVFLHLIIL